MSSTEKIEAWLTWGSPGHELEYVLVVLSKDDDLYEAITSKIVETLGNEWIVSDRGGRIEIVYRENIRFRDDEKIEKSVRDALSGDAVREDFGLEFLLRVFLYS